MRVLAADIGASNLRLGIFEDDVASAIYTAATSAIGPRATGVDVVRAALEALGSEVGDVERACLAVAGPVSRGRATLTKAPLAFAVGDLSRTFGFPVDLVNDLGILTCGYNDLVPFRHLMAPT